MPKKAVFTAPGAVFVRSGNFIKINNLFKIRLLDLVLLGKRKLIGAVMTMKLIKWRKNEISK